MSVNQNVIVMYGWVVEVTPEITSWAEDYDYILPIGFTFKGMDSNELAIGVEVFDSGNNRWGPMEAADKSFNEEMYEHKLIVFQDHYVDLFKKMFSKIVGDVAPEFHVFINHS